MIFGGLCKELFYFYVEQQRIPNNDTEKLPKLKQCLDCFSSVKMALSMPKKFKIHVMKMQHKSNFQIIILCFSRILYWLKACQRIISYIYLHTQLIVMG